MIHRAPTDREVQQELVELRARFEATELPRDLSDEQQLEHVLALVARRRRELNITTGDNLITTLECR
jgi:hypothetical protein